MDPLDVVAPLSPGRWDRANRLLVRKALAEFSHELILTPTAAGAGWYTVDSDDGEVSYRFRAVKRALDHWDIAPDSITRRRGADELPLDAVELVLEFRATLGLSDADLPVYLEEITSTLAGAAYKLSRPALPADRLARADFQTVEAAMTEGHPVFVANNGRLGLDSAEYLAYAPEAGPMVRLYWLAARRDVSTFTCGADLDYRSLLERELGAAGTLARFADRMAGYGLDLADYHLIPVHPWQWWNRLSVTFAGELAQRRLVFLGEGEDEYQPQQSIRTFFNRTAPHRHYVKTAMSVLNMGFLRGLSAEYMRDTPAINDWVASLVADDDLLKRAGFGILREHAAVGYHHPHLTAATRPGSPYRKMLAALWRESPVPSLAPGERLLTMAALLHVDPDGNALVTALIAAAPGSPRTWLRCYLDAYLRPLLHCFFAYELVFMPHGENVILVVDSDGVPLRVFCKDIGEEVAVTDPELPLPTGVDRIRAAVPPELKTLAVFTDVFDGFLRFLAALLAAEGLVPEDEFWAEVAGCVRAYQAERPELAARFAAYDLFVDSFPRSCLNRLQLANNRQMVDLSAADPVAALRFAGTLTNPLARYAAGQGR